ncbi:hypothetical protein JYU34_000814 [Plutella xylostella]|uniref:Sensory neuron membrane protein 2 n=2 Tax=Plutella xylostella TaxID=51655 RepID=A0ABQ7R8N1_PLUXY|nr:hypothetical protein JYU34_000814 [Plutella xylostella]
MKFGVRSSAAVLAVGAVVAVAVAIVGYAVVPGIIDETILQEVALENNTIALERFENVPFPLNFTIHLFSVENGPEVLAGGIPRVRERGPYIYKLYQTRVIEGFNEDTISYRFLQTYEFDKDASFPNTEDDRVTIANVAYHSVLQVAEQLAPTLLGALSLALDSVFGRELNSPLATVRVGDLVFDGIPLCRGGGLLASVACAVIRDAAKDIPNMEVQPDGSLVFSLFAHKRDKLGELYKVDRGLKEPLALGSILQWNQRDFLPNWAGGPLSQCARLNGTDTGIFPPFIKRDTVLYGFNTDICRSVELRYQYDTQYSGVPAYRFAANDWFLSNREGCFCLNVTAGVAAPDGCLLHGAQEMYSCIGSYLVLTYPHFLFAHPTYANMVVGMTPDLERHRIFLDLEPNSGYPVRGAKRAQLNVFFRRIPGVAATANFDNTLVPIFWLEEGITLPDNLIQEIKDRLLGPLELVAILLPTVIALSGAVMLIGAAMLFNARRPRARASPPPSPIPSPPPPPARRPEPIVVYTVEADSPIDSPNHANGNT